MGVARVNHLATSVKQPLQKEGKKQKSTPLDMLSILKGNKSLIINHINNLKDDLVQIDATHVYGEWDWSGGSELYELVNKILLKFAQRFCANSPFKRDFDNFIDVLLSNVYSLSKEKESSKNILDTVSQTLCKTDQKTENTFGFPTLHRIEKSSESQNSLEHKILFLKRLVKDIKKESAISSGVIEGLLKPADEMPLYLQVGFVTSLLLCGEINSALKISLMFKKKLRVWVAISDYCHKIFEHINEQTRSFYVYKMSSNGIPPVIIRVSDSLSANKKMLRTFEELSAVAYCFSVCGDEEKSKYEKTIEKEHLRYVPYKLYNCGQNNLAIEFLKNDGEEVDSEEVKCKEVKCEKVKCEKVNPKKIKREEERLELKCLSYLSAGRYEELINEYEKYRTKNNQCANESKRGKINERIKSAYMLAQAFRFKFEYKFYDKFYEDMKVARDAYIQDCVKKLDINIPDIDEQNIDEVLIETLKCLWKDDSVVDEGNPAKPPFNTNDLFVLYCFKKSEAIIKYTLNSENYKSNETYKCCLGYYRAFTQLEKFHTENCKDKTPEEFKDFINKKFSKYCDDESDLCEAYETLTEVFSKNKNLFLRSTHFLSLAPKIEAKKVTAHIKCWLKCLYFVFLTFKIQDRLAIHSDTLGSQSMGTYMKLERYRQKIVETKKHMLPLFNTAIVNDPAEGKILKLGEPTKKKEDPLKDSNVYTLSLSALGDNLPMWDRYADYGRGVFAVISKEMLYRPDLDIIPRDESEYYSRKILRLEDSRKMYRMAYIREEGEKGEKAVRVTHVGSFKKEEQEKKVINAKGEEVVYKMRKKDYLDDFEKLLAIYIALGNNILNQKDECPRHKRGIPCDSKIEELVQYYHNKIRYLFKSHVFESEDEIRLISFDHTNKESLKLPDRYLHYVYWTCPLKIDHVIIGPRAEKFRSLVPYLEDSVLETKKSIFTSDIETPNVELSKIRIL